MFIREDFRRDGLAAMHLTDTSLMTLVDSSFSESKINIGYPLICATEYKYCADMLSSKHENEYCVVGHARPDHIRALTNVLKGTINSSANIWFPVSNTFLDNSINLEPISALDHLKSMIELYKSQSTYPLDVALVDCAGSKNVLDRVIYWADNLFKTTDVRNVIICDTLGIMTPTQTKYLLTHLGDYASRLELHTHNDTNQALANINVAEKMNIAGVGTSLFHASERMNMVDPRELSFMDIDHNAISHFEKNYLNERGSIQKILHDVFGDNTIITGSQLRLRGRNNSFKLLFGITSDKYIAEQLFNASVDGADLARVKDELFAQRKIYFTKPELEQLRYIING